MANSNVPLSGRILVAEDACDTRQLLCVFLEQAGLTVDCANDGIMVCQMVEAAMAATTKTPPHLILMDINMPKLDGLAAMQRLRNAGWNGPVIALTARTLGQDRAVCLRAGFCDFVTKPIDLTHLLQIVANHLGHCDSAVQPAEPLPARSEGLLDDPRILPAERARILLGFITRMQDIAATIDRAVGEGNLLTIMESAHTLHGSAGLLGFLQISEAAKAVEEQVRANADLHPLLASALQLACLCRQTADEYVRATQYPR